MIKYIYEDQKGRPRICPVCGREFRPAPEHVYVIGPPSARKPVCSYTCMRVWERGKAAKKKRKG